VFTHSPDFSQALCTAIGVSTVSSNGYILVNWTHAWTGLLN